MKFLKNLAACVSCASVALLMQSCGDDTASSPVYALSSSSVQESSSCHSGLDPESSSSVPESSAQESSSSVENLSSSSQDVGGPSSSETSLSAGTESSSAVATSSAVEPTSSETLQSSSSSEAQSSVAESSSSQAISSSETPSSSSAQPIKIDFYNGADISEVQEYERNNTKFYDVDGKESDIFTILKNHGFNSIRLRTFVSPKAKYGYAASGCGHDSEAYGDKDHVVAFAKKVKAAGMGLLVDIHYSDVWADPGKQIIPERWRNVNNANAMADSVYAYTKDLMIALKNAGATPDMVQVGNETTPGILIHKPNSKTDCW